jgi:predicted lipoprotein with Yx(FWY)xxD motif
MRHPRTVIAIVGLSAAAAAGGVALAATAGGSTTTPSAAAPSSVVEPSATMSTPPVPAAPVSSATSTIHTARATVGGATETILVNGKGLPLYFYKPDTATRSMVTGALAALWPPLDVTAPTENGATGTLKVMDTSNGSQVTFNGHFLYTFAEDSPGQVTGQGVQNFFVATPGISPSHRASTSVTTAPPSTTNGYGY